MSIFDTLRPGAQIDDQLETLRKDTDTLREDVDGLQAALDRGPVEPSGPTVNLSQEECDDLGQWIIDHPNTHPILESGGEYPIKTEPRLTDPDQEHHELVVQGNGAEIVVADESVGSFGWFGRTAGGAFSTLSLQDLILVVDPDQGYDAGWGRFWIDERVENTNLSIAGARRRPGPERRHTSSLDRVRYQGEYPSTGLNDLGQCIPFHESARVRPTDVLRVRVLRPRVRRA
ncbi:hypothetical protein [Saliphagus infecundisoli]|uniref:Uncharacterized protein n=1 Tax=Saliphagus infecundisoli TaxID=1849069 RepID=A0ABD5QJ31_9EURY|nr:hypothetical protein [Saliphagus infecundisoli]